MAKFPEMQKISKIVNFLKIAKIADFSKISVFQIFLKIIRLKILLNFPKFKKSPELQKLPIIVKFKSKIQEISQIFTKLP